MPRIHRFAAWAVALLCVGLSPYAHAQYKWTDAQGKVHYGDTPPAGADVSTMARHSGGESSAAAKLPLELARSQRDYPVVLYATDDCKPCAMGRDLLNKRGIPYSEKRVVSDRDVEAFRQLGFQEVGFPAISVGRERMAGFDSRAWDRLLDAAQYPQESKLPAGYRTPAPSALVPALASAGRLEPASAPADPSRLLDGRGAGSGPSAPARTGDSGFRF